MNICVDIDGILCEETFGDKEYINRKPIPENIKKVNKLFKEHWVVLYTARDVIHRCETKQWLKKHKVNYHDVLFGKPKFDVLIDDKACNSFAEWEHLETIKKIDKELDSL